MDEAVTTEERTIIPDSQFVVAWQTASSAQEVADNLDLKRASVVQRACNLRNKGVRLKKFPRVNNGRQARGEEYYVDLNALAGEHGELSEPKADDDDASDDDI